MTRCSSWSQSIRILALVLGMVLSFGIVDAAHAQTTWVQRTPATNPGPRVFHAMVYDSARNVCVQFGGRGFNSIRDGQTWEYDGTNWVQRTFTGDTPAPREQHAMAYDSVRHVTVLFGGETNSGSSGETWEYNGSAWTLRSSTGPSARRAHTMAFDSARGVTVLACGQDSNGNLGDTWEWDGTSWMLRQPQATTPLAGRVFPAMSFDSDRGVCVLTAGDNGSSITPLYDIQEWNGTSWTFRTSGFVAYGHCMIFDSARHTSVIATGQGILPVYIGEWNGLQVVANSQPTSPPARAYGAMAFDTARGVGVLYGGADQASGGGRTDTWEFVPCVRITAQPFSRTACPGSTVTIAVAATGQGILTYQWRKAGVPISTVTNPSAATATLVLTSVGNADEALYDCIINVAGCGGQTSVPAGLTINCVPFGSAAPADNAGFTGTRPTPGPGSNTTFNFQSLTVGDGSIFGLGSGEVLNLNNGLGTLSIGPGGVFVGNGTILGNIFNAGLFIIPIVRAAVINQTYGGVIHYNFPPQVGPVEINYENPPVVNPDTFLQVGTPGGGGAGGWGDYRINAPTFTSSGTTGWDGHLECTGSFTQTQSGSLRLFIAGDVKGETYSLLKVGQAAELHGTLQIVLQPELFDFVPSVGQSFDVIDATGGVVLPALPETIEVQTLMTAAGAARLGLTLTPYLSKFLADPNQLVVMPPGYFTYALANGGNTLRVTMALPVCGSIATTTTAQFICPAVSASFTATAGGKSGPFTYQWQFRGRNGVEPIDWVTIVPGANTLSPSGQFLFNASGTATQTITLDHDGSAWPVSGPGSIGEVRCTISGPCDSVTHVANFGIIGTKCQPADIARDDGVALPPFGPCDSEISNTGVNEGDYNAFFQGFFEAFTFCDIADDQGTALAPFGPGGGDNNGVNEGDYNCFFQFFFNGCP